MWEFIAFMAVETALLAAGVAAGIRASRRRLRSLRDAAVACGLLVVEPAKPFRLRLKAPEAPVEVRIRYAKRKRYGARVAVAFAGPPGFSGVRIRREQEKPEGAREVEIGDKAFDRAFYIVGPVRLLSSLFDAETRHLLITLNAETDFDIAGNELRAEMFDSQIPLLLPLLVDVAQRFSQPFDAAERLAANAQRDPDAAVRLQNLLLLARENPGEPLTVELLRTACSDPSPLIRLRAAKELHAEGHGVLLELAESAEDDALSAQAVASLDRALPVERALAILGVALRRRRLETARACLEVLGRCGTAGAVEELKKVLTREHGGLAVAAAQALGVAGSPEAEPSLIAALGRKPEELPVAAAQALGRVGSAAAVLPLKEAAERSPELRRATRQAIAEIQARLQGASPGQLSLAGSEVGQLSMAQAEAGQVSLAPEGGGELSLGPGDGAPRAG
jgi:HEAT repeat protein